MARGDTGSLEGHFLVLASAPLATLESGHFRVTWSALVGVLAGLAWTGQCRAGQCCAVVRAVLYCDGSFWAVLRWRGTGLEWAGMRWAGLCCACGALLCLATALARTKWPAEIQGN